MSLPLSQALEEHYADFYECDTNLLEWRRLGAADKCSIITRLCSKLDHDKVAEIGCGDGAILQCLSALNFGAKLTGFEISASGIRRAQEKNIANCEIYLFDGSQLPCPDQSFDLAILTHVIEHVEHPRQLIYEGGRIAKNVFIEVPLEDNRSLSSDFVFDRTGHINFYNPKTIRQLVQSCGMRIHDAYLSHSSFSSYAYRKGAIRGRLTYLTKELALRAAPRTATNLFTYHYSLTCSRQG